MRKEENELDERIDARDKRRHSTGQNAELEKTTDTFFKAVETSRDKPEATGLTPRTTNAGAFTRRLLSKDWNLLEAYDQVSHLLEDEADYKRAQHETKKLRRQLQRQKEEARQRLANEKKETRDFGRALEEDACQYKMSEEEKLRQRKEDDLAQRRARDDQWQDMQRRKEEERSREQREIDAMIRAAQNALKEDQRKKNEKQAKQKSWAETAKAENAAALRRREEQKLADAVEDKRLMAIQKGMMDKAEADRVSYFDKIKEKSAKNQNAFEKQAGAEEARRKKEDEDRVAREIEEKTKKDKEAAEKKASWLANLSKQGVVAVQAQLDEQAARRQKQKEEDHRFGEQYKREAELYREQEADKERHRREQERENAQFLKDQMATHKKMGKFGEIDMSRTEQAINHSLLHQAKDIRGQETIFRNMQLQLRHLSDQTNMGSPKSPKRETKKLGKRK